MERLVYAEWGWPEYGAMARSLLDNDGDTRALALLEERLRRLFGKSEVLLVNRGRWALDIALRSLAEIGGGRNEVIYPGYICASVIATIRQCGLVGVPVDIRGDLNLDPALVEAKMTERTLAVIAVHMYGCPADMPELSRICRARRTFLIDDAAQVVGIEMDGQQLGTFGDVGLTSFSQSKTIVAGGINAGGVLLINNPDLAGRIRKHYAALSPGRYEFRDFVEFMRDSQLDTYLARPTYYMSELRRRLGKETPVRQCPPRQMAAANAAVALRQLDGLASKLSGRIAVCESYARVLAAHPRIAFPQFRPGRYLTRVMLTLPRGTRLPHVRRTLRQKGIETRRPYDAWRVAGASLPNSEDAASRTVEVPSHSTTGTGSIERVVAALEEALAVPGAMRDAADDRDSGVPDREPFQEAAMLGESIED